MSLGTYGVSLLSGVICGTGLYVGHLQKKNELCQFMLVIRWNPLAHVQVYPSAQAICQQNTHVADDGSVKGNVRITGMQGGCSGPAPATTAYI